MSLSRRLVTTHDRVYVTLGYRAAVSVLNATTGAIVDVYDPTKNTDEIVLQDGILLAHCRKEIPDYPRGATAWDVTVRRSGSSEASPLASASIGDEKIVAVDTTTGTTLWEKPEKRIVTLSLASLGGRVCYHTFEELVCLELDSGKEVWREGSEPWPDLTGTGISLVMYNDMVLMTSSEGLVARSLETGETLWRGPRIPRHAPRQPADLLIADGLLWTSLTPEMPMGTVPKQPMDTPRVTGTAVQGLDPRTGEVRRTVDIGQLISVGHHVRCYRSKGTNQYLLWPKRGIEFVDIRGPGEGEGSVPRNGPESANSHMRCDWTRGECSYGVMPANGLLYVPPHPCVCYTGVALNGFNAFAAAKRRTKEEGRRTKEERLERGPAYGESRAESRESRAETKPDRGPAHSLTLTADSGVGRSTQDSGPPSHSGSGLSTLNSGLSWPTYRHDAARSGSTAAAVPTDLQTRWRVKLGGRLAQPVIADGQVFIASVDEHTINCLDAETGHRSWSYTAGGRIDSSPTFHNHLILFGCRDGWVYCIRASDGSLVWRFQAAPEERRMIAFGQVESAWGIHGSVVVVDDTVYFAAGRSSFLDGGIYLYGLDPASGRIVHQAHLVGPWPDIRADQGQPYHMEGAKSDVLVSDGTSLYMFHNKFDLGLNQVKTTPRGAGGDRVTGLHLTTTSGFLDDTLHDRFYWFHNRLWPGSHFAVRGPKSGHILVFDEQTTYGQRAFSRRERLSPKFTPGGEGYLLFADHSDTRPLMDRKSGRGTEYRPSKPSKWSTHVPVRALAMVLTKDVLFLAGPPDVIPPDDPHAALEGRAGAKLWAVSPEDGKRLAEWNLNSSPVFDGMSAAGGKLLVAQTNGTLTCMGSGHRPDRRRVDDD
jgi:outer membrane protein assembly factor BamB